MIDVLFVYKKPFPRNATGKQQTKNNKVSTVILTSTPEKIIIAEKFANILPARSSGNPFKLSRPIDKQDASPSSGENEISISLCGNKNADEVFPCSDLENDNETDGIAWMGLLKLVVMFLYKCSQLMESSKYLFETCNMAQVME